MKFVLVSIFVAISASSTLYHPVDRKQISIEDSLDYDAIYYEATQSTSGIAYAAHLLEIRYRLIVGEVILAPPPPDLGELVEVQWDSLPIPLRAHAAFSDASKSVFGPVPLGVEGVSRTKLELARTLLALEMLSEINEYMQRYESPRETRYYYLLAENREPNEANLVIASRGAQLPASEIEAAKTKAAENAVHNLQVESARSVGLMTREYLEYPKYFISNLENDDKMRILDMIEDGRIKNLPFCEEFRPLLQK